ncbi:invasin domain 3-containing protein, partial [Enterobacter kobei]|uniref:invasin domain 3-containing protein n=1 Tax=Enterobacter kobei TaxID=208224 RepID=UPI003CECA4A6
ISEANSTLKASPENIIADGKARSVITLTLNDAEKQPIAGEDVAFTVSGVQGTTLSAVKDNGDGTYTAELSGTQVGVATISAYANGVTLSTLSAKVTLGKEIVGTVYSLSALPANIAADGIEASILTLTIHDKNGKPVSGQTVAFRVSGLNETTLGNVKDNNDGTYSAELRGTQAGEALITAYVGGTELSALSTKVTLATVVSEANSSLKALPENIVANGTDTSTLTLTINDKNGKPISGQLVTFRIGGVNGTTLGQVKDNKDGTYSTLLQGTQAGSAAITVAVNNKQLNSLSATVILTAAPIFTGISTPANDYTFNLDSGFPQTGFNGAKFILNISGAQSDYIWSTNQRSDIVSVNNVGLVTLHGIPSGTVAITAQTKNGPVQAISYLFTLKGWYFQTNGAALNFSDANAFCSSNSASIPTISQLNGNSGFGAGSRGTTGGLWSEWGNISNYNANWTSTSGWYWSSTKGTSGVGSIVRLTTGTVNSASADSKYKGACRQEL